jgi:hypothetical protein
MDDTMSDHIEEEEGDATTQRREVDAVDADEDGDEDRQTRPSRSRGESSSKKAAVESEHDDDAGEDDDATPAFDADALGNKPMSRHDGQKLQGMASDWNMIETHLRESAFSLLTEISTAVAEYADDGTATKELERLDVLMREIIDIDVEIKSHEQTLKDLHQQVLGGDEISNVLELYKTQTRDKLDDYRKRTSRQRYAKRGTAPKRGDATCSRILASRGGR